MAVFADAFPAFGFPAAFFLVAGVRDVEVVAFGDAVVVTFGDAVVVTFGDLALRLVPTALPVNLPPNLPDLASSSTTASAKVSASIPSLSGKVALMAPCFTYGPKRPACSSTGRLSLG